MSEILFIVILTYFGSGVLFAMHIGLTHLAYRRVTTGAPTAQFEEAFAWFVFIYGQPGGVWGTMGRLLVNPWYFTRIAKDINQ